ncbi:putative pyridoxal-phosphate dependent enzyme, CCR4-NOT complex subunit/5 domain superfamily [Plasmopara halstedii]
MAGQRKLLSEIDRTLKKVSEGVEVFNEIWDKVYAATAQNQKEKHEADLKKEIKKLQRFRDQIKTWIGNSDVKDKRPLVDARKLIEHKMEEFKVCEKETKTKAYSKEGLAQVERLDPEQQARQQSHAWIQDCLNQFNVQIEALESDVERLHSAKGRSRNKSEIVEKEKLLSQHKWHILKLEQINRLLDNAALEPEQVDVLKEDVEYYLEANQEPDFMETCGGDDIYESLDLDTLGQQLQVALPTEQDVGIEDASVVASAASTTVPTTTSARGKTPRKSVTTSVITGIGRAGVVKPIDLKTSTPSRSTSATKNDVSPLDVNKSDDSKLAKARTTPQRPKSGSSSSEKGLSKAPTPVSSSPAVSTPGCQISPPTPQRTPSPSVGKGQFGGTSSSSSSASPAPAKLSVSGPSPSPSTASLPPPIPNPSPSASTNSSTTAPAAVPAPTLSGAESAASPPTVAASNSRPENSPKLTEEQKQVLRLIDESFHFIPESRDSEKVNRYVPRNLYPTPSSFPASPSPLFSSAPIFEKLDVDTLFFIFYYQQGSYQQYLAARELKRRTWGYHKKYKTWFKRHEEPQVTGEDYEQGTFVYFDYETGWCQRIKTEFTFEYSFLEDELHVLAAAARIDGHAHRTPVQKCHALEMIVNEKSPTPKQLFFKCENFQKVGAFKYRGALNAVKKFLHETEQENMTNTTFITHSSGNHAQALSLAARDANCKAVIVMPKNSPSVKQNAVRGYGADIVLCEPTNEARAKAANEIVEATGAYFVHSSNDIDVMSGQGTIALEILEQVKQEYGVDLDAIVVPIGGAGLCSGVAMAAKSVQPGIKVFAVEPAGAADAYNSFQKRELMGHSTPVNTVADGLRTILGDNNWPIVRDFVDDILLVTDDEIVWAMKLIWERMKLVVEPSGAVATAAVLTNKLPAKVTNIGIVLSGGNIDLEKLPWITEKSA